MRKPDGPHIKFVFGNDGSVKIEPSGFGGSLCRAATGPYEHALAGDKTSTPTAEAEMEPVLLEQVREKERA